MPTRYGRAEMGPPQTVLQRKSSLGLRPDKHEFGVM